MLGLSGGHQEGRVREGGWLISSAPRVGAGDHLVLQVGEEQVMATHTHTPPGSTPGTLILTSSNAGPLKTSDSWTYSQSLQKQTFITHT